VKLADRYLGRELILPFLWGVGAFTVLLMGTQALYELAKLAVQGASLVAIVKLFFLGLPSIMVLTFPMAMLLATLLGFQRLSNDNEVVALFAAGISFYRVLAPVLVVAALVAVVTFGFNEKVVPWTTNAEEALRSQLIGTARPRRPIVLPEYTSEGLARLLVARGYDRNRRAMEDVHFFDFSKERLAGYVEAREAQYDGEGKWVFIDGTTIRPEAGGSVSIHFDRQVITLNRSPDQVAANASRPDALTFQELRRYIAAQESMGLDTSELQVQLQDKLALPFACFVFALIGAPLGIRPQRGSSALGLGVSIIIIFGFYVVGHYMHILGAGGSVSPVVASWLPNVLGLVAGCVLAVRAPK